MSPVACTLQNLWEPTDLWGKERAPPGFIDRSADIKFAPQCPKLLTLSFERGWGLKYFHQTIAIFYLTIAILTICYFDHISAVDGLRPTEMVISHWNTQTFCDDGTDCGWYQCECVILIAGVHPSTEKYVQWKNGYFKKHCVFRRTDIFIKMEHWFPKRFLNKTSGNENFTSNISEWERTKMAKNMSLILGKNNKIQRRTWEVNKIGETGVRRAYENEETSKNDPKLGDIT